MNATLTPEQRLYCELVDAAVCKERLADAAESAGHHRLAAGYRQQANDRYDAAEGVHRRAKLRGERWA